MRIARRICALAAAAMLAACASMVPSEQARKELLPTGRLRVAIGVGAASTTFWAVRDPATGLTRGVTVDLAYALARRLEAEVALVTYANEGDIAAGGPKGEWDVAFMPEDAERRKIVHFGPAYADAAIAVPGGKPAALAYASRFIEEAKRDGTVRRALDNAGLKNAPVAP
jgi:polar amino acid transport system substrate-binding protein